MDSPGNDLNSYETDNGIISQEKCVQICEYDNQCSAVVFEPLRNDKGYCRKKYNNIRKGA